MDNVTVDLLNLSVVLHKGSTYNRVGLCVDRESGWMVATPHQTKGFTRKKMAKAMYLQWEMFGTPSVVCSDRVTHFIGGWWQTLCALFGVNPIYGQAYHHQANGSVENAGQQLIKNG